MSISTRLKSKEIGHTFAEESWEVFVLYYRYRYDVLGRSTVDAFFVANLVSIARIYMTKRMSWAPYLVVIPLTYTYLYPLRLQKHNKKLFDMCNVGE